MFVKNGGVGAFCTPKEYERKYKPKGYVIVKQDEEENDLFDLTNKELRKMLEEKDLPTYGNKKELVERLEEGE